MTLFVIMGSASCAWPYSTTKATPNPKLQWDVFDEIGRQGIREKTTLDELQGDYKGNLIYAIPAAPQSIIDLPADDIRLIEWLSDGEMELRGRIDGNRLALTVSLPDGDLLELDEMPPFELDAGIMTAPITAQANPDEDNFTMVSMVKVYPEGLMVDGILRQEILLSDNNHVLMIFHFQMINEK